MMETTELEKNTTKSITEETEHDLEKLLAEYELQANSPHNDGWTAQHYRQKADNVKIELQIRQQQQLNG